MAINLFSHCAARGRCARPLHSSSNWTPEYKPGCFGAGFQRTHPPPRARCACWLLGFYCEQRLQAGTVQVHMRGIVSDKPEGRPVVRYVTASPLIQLFMSPPAFSAFHHITYTCSPNVQSSHCLAVAPPHLLDGPADVRDNVTTGQTGVTEITCIIQITRVAEEVRQI